jgi:hypothetical protein
MCGGHQAFFIFLNQKNVWQPLDVFSSFNMEPDYRKQTWEKNIIFKNRKKIFLKTFALLVRKTMLLTLVIYIPSLSINAY